MKLSTRSKYGLRAIFALAGLEKDVPMSLHSLAIANNIPFKYLERVFMLLRQAGIVDAHPGKRGGYFLAKPAKKITLGEVIRTLDGTIAPVSCVSRIAYRKCTCPDEKSCPLRTAMEEVRESMISVVDRKTIADYVKKR
ncbi:MAG TPA: Rrf2 family transcriptional regulator [Spirochaetia bacterium]|nr:Rrf2 family transcriptional regulator [Spirochaetia bacterium]